MKTFFVLVLPLLAANIISGQQTACDNTFLTVNPELAWKSGDISLKNKKQSITFTLLKQTDCTVGVTAYNDMQMKLAVMEYTLPESDNCETGFFKAGAKDKDYKLIVCKKNELGNPIESTDKKLFLAIKGTTKDQKVVVNIESIQGPECGMSEITLKESNQTISYPAPSTTFNANSECDVTVKGISNRAFTMNILKFGLPEGDCNKDYIAADAQQITTESKKICTTADAKNPITAPNGILHLKIVTKSGNDKSALLLNFKTEYPECGSANVEIPENGTELSLPPANQVFKDNTFCTIKFSGKNGMNFKLTIPSISLAAGDCTNDYVSASTNESQLPNNAYKKCGSNPVTDAFVSEGGIMYTQIKITDVKNNPKVQLKFESGADKPAQCVLVSVILFKLLSLVLY